MRAIRWASPRCVTLSIAVIAVALTSCDKHTSADGAGPMADPSPPRRIVALAPSSVEILYELGVGDRLVGVGTHCTYPPEAARQPRVGGLRDADLETILTLDPEVVILRGRQEKLEALCERRHIRVYHDPTDALADLSRAIVEIGELVGCPERAIALRDRLRDDLAAVQRRVGSARPVKVLFALRSPDRLANITTVARGSYLHELIELAGGENVFGELDVAYPQVSTEEIVARGPEVIIEAMPGATGRHNHASIVEQWRQLGPIPAVESGRVHVLGDEHVLTPSPRGVRLTARQFVSILHPEVGSDG